MIQYAFYRLLSAIPTFVGVTLVAFLMLHNTPGDPAVLIGGPDATVEDRQRIRDELGLDRPVLQQYFTYLGNLFRGDLGQSWYTREPVERIVADAFPKSVELVLFTTFFASLLGVTLGVIASLSRASFLDRAVMVLATIGISIPNFWLGLLLLMFFSVQLGWLPVSGYGGPFWTWDGIKYMILPAITAGSSQAAYVARLTRSSMLDVLREDFIRTGRAKGLSASVVIVKHALRNVLLPVITMIGMLFGFMLGQAVVVETIFAWPGMGRMLINSIFARDVPVVLAGVITLAGSFIVINLLVDLTYGIIDPRVRY